MGVVESLMSEEFCRRYGPTEPLDPTTCGNYGCCEECRARCEAVAGATLKRPRGALSFESRMGAEALVSILPVLATAVLRNIRENFHVLAALNYRLLPALDPEQRDALRWLLEFCQANEYGSLPEQVRLNELHSFLDLLGEKENYPPPIGPGEDAQEEP